MNFQTLLKESIPEELDERGWKNSLIQTSLRNQALNRSVSTLSFFRFFQGQRGINYGNSLDVCFEVESDNHLLEVFSKLNHSGEFMRYFESPQKSNIHLTPNGFSALGCDCNFFEKIAWADCYLDGYLCNVSFGINKVLIRANTIEPFYVSYEVEEHHIEAAIHLEKRLKNLDVKITNPPAPVKNYVCPEYYRTLFS